jgi:tetratricopeptide (TPR) repeat protein
MRTRLIAAVLVALFFAALTWRLLAAWWYDDIGNLALERGDEARALALFERGLSLAPGSRLLLEDRGRALLDRDPAAALLDFQSAACGAPCITEMGDAQARLGNADAAVADYHDAKAAVRLASAVDRIAAAGNYVEAIALERALIQRLGDDILLRADLAATYAKIGELSLGAAQATPARADEYRSAAIAAYDRASELAPFNEGYLLSYATAQANWGDKRAARAAFHRVLALHPHQAEAERALAALGEPTPRPSQ